MNQRPIEFRAWDKEEKRMIKPFSLATEPRDKFVNHIFRDKKFIFLQYTGLKDIKGVKIFEGDIVRIDNTNEYTKKVTEQLCVIEWKDGQFIQKGTTPYWKYKNFPNDFWKDVEFTQDSLNHLYCKTIEVIGNIYEHKDLLK